jgi:hypothetical protein
MTTDELAGGSPRDDETILVRGTTHLLAVVPHLIGYHPDHSLVVIATRLQATTGGVHRGAVAFTARVDLPPAQHLTGLARALAQPLHRLAGEGGQLLLHAFGYDLPTGADGDADPAYVEGLLQVLEMTALRAGAELHDLDLVRDQGQEHRRLVVATRWVDDPWLPVPSAADVPAAADLVLQGRGHVASRSVVTESVRRRDEDAAAATGLALALLSTDPSRLDPELTLGALAAWVVHGQPVPTARDRAWIAVQLHDRQVRDALLGRWLPHTFQLEDVLSDEETQDFCSTVPPWPREDSDGALDRLIQLAAQTPRELTAPLVTIAAFVAWVTGQGTVANEACDLALEVDPHYRMAGLLRQCLEQGVKPPRTHRAARRERRRRGRHTAA